MNTSYIIFFKSKLTFVVSPGSKIVLRDHTKKRVKRTKGQSGKELSYSFCAAVTEGHRLGHYED